MPQIDKTALVPVSAKTMFAVVNDVESYPQFVDGCRASRVLQQSNTHMVAEIEVSKGGFTQAFTTRNQLTENEIIELKLQSGPFKYLTGKWHFIALDDHACKVVFHLDFEFNSKVLALAFNRVFSKIAEAMLQAFVQRAKQLGSGA
ncbi:MAG: type II toxin-antitoxin system RatA family toxin [Gammaproteobacteria bacterium]|nr:type II toxin-antitoxin system RatA family toxin [Gammaproteobacteria bacterium]NVK88944.1 type II toxin-antitoxin system RatA family toxin [Gammaproteobacteria bacterium]